MKQGVFRRALERNSDVGLMFNHTRSLKPQNMILAEDSIGLKIDVDVTDAEVIQNAHDGKLTGFSFGFRCLQADFEERDGLPKLRNVTDIDLIEVSILNCTPAYFATELDARGLLEQRGEVSEVEIDDTEIKALEQLNTYKAHWNFIKGE
nr:MAG TPA: head maturation protease [Caudoviricetes sp.]